MNQVHSLLYRSYAKINLYLDVLARRDDGFHTIETIFQSISLCDSLECALDDTALTLRVEGSDLSPGEDNLVYRAAQVLRTQYTITQGARMVLHKHIPIAAGLAGGSGNAAAALVALNRLWGINAPLEELLVLAASLGSDIPYCLSGGTQVGTQRGEQLTPLPPLPTTWLLLAHPPVAVNTPEIYHHPRLCKSGALPTENGRSSQLNKAVEHCAQGHLESALFNAMESAALIAYPIIADYKNRLQAAGCAGVLMSGSGPTVFGLCHDEAHARSIQHQLPDLNTTIAHTINHGLEALTK